MNLPARLSLALGVALTGLLNGQDAFTSAVDVTVVNVDVIALDRSGEPVRGLAREAFTVFEERGRKKQKVPIAYFSELDTAERVPAVTLFLDERNLSAAGRDATLRRLLPQLRALTGRGIAFSAVRFDGSLQTVSGFTQDVEAVAKALEDVLGTPSVADPTEPIRASALGTMERLLRQARGTPADRRLAMASLGSILTELRSYQQGLWAHTEHSLMILGAYVRTLAAEPGQKLVLYVTDGLALRPFDAALDQIQSLTAGGTTRGGDLVEDTGVGRAGDGLGTMGDGGLLARDFGMDLGQAHQEGEVFASEETLERLIAEANTYRATVLPIKAQEGDAQAAVSARERGRAVDVQLSNTNEGLLRLAAGTGGRACLTEAAVEACLAGFLGQRRHGYSLGFRPTATADGETVGLRIKARGARDLLYRQSYLFRDPHGRLADQTWSTLLLSAPDAAQAPANELALEVDTVTITPADELFEVQIALVFPIAQIGLEEVSEGLYTAAAQVALAVADEAGRPITEQRLQIPLQIPEGDLETARESHFQARASLRLPAGSHRLAVGVRDQHRRTSSFVLSRLTTGADP